MNVMLLAAGEGTRLRPHTLILPKPAIPFLNMPLAAYPLGFLGDISVEKLVVNTFHLPQKIVSLFENFPHGAKELAFSHELYEILGSGGGIKKAEAHLRRENFVMMNADEVILPQDPQILGKAIDAHEKSGAIATLVVMKHEKVGTQFGGVWTRGHRVLGFGKEAITGSEEAWHFIGVQILSPRVFDYLTPNVASNILYDGLTQAMRAGEQVQIYPIDCQWFETGNEGDFIEASIECLKHLSKKTSQGLYLEKLFARFQTQNSFIKKEAGICLCESSAKLDPQTQLVGFNSLGAGSSTSHLVHLENSMIGPGVNLRADQSIKNQIVLTTT